MTAFQLFLFFLLPFLIDGNSRVKANQEGTTYRLYLLSGQSNMDGFGYVRDLPPDLRGPFEGVRIFHGNPAPDDAPVDGRGRWSALRPGHGVGFASDGKTNNYSDRFGLELTFVQRLQQLRPGERIALVKYSRGGASIDPAAAGDFGCFDPDYGDAGGVNQYDHLLATLRYALSAPDIDGDGRADRLVPAGILWMQGESDGAFTAAIAGKYEGHLKRLMDLLRAALRQDDLPVVIGRISDSGRDDDGRVWNHGERVRAAQAAFVAGDPAAALVTSTDSYGYSDKWHYDSEGYLDLGRRFAEALVGIGD